MIIPNNVFRFLPVLTVCLAAGLPSSGCQTRPTVAAGAVAPEKSIRPGVNTESDLSKTAFSAGRNTQV